MNIQRLESEALAGSTVAQAILGICYLDGIDVQPDYAKASRWLSLAAEKGASRAMLHLGRIYEDGLGVTRAITRALELYKAASDRHEFFSHIYLGRIYATGKGGVSRDERAALVYYGRAAAEAEHLVDCPEIHEAIAYVEAHRS